MTHPLSLRARTLLTATPILLAVSLQVSADNAGENGFEPLVYHGSSLDRSMTALNETIQSQYAKEQLLASLVDPVSDQDRFDTVAAAGITSRAAVRSSGNSEFGPAVFDSPSLESNLMALNETLFLRGQDVFVAVADNASDPSPSISGKDFDYVAAILDGVLKADAMRNLEGRSESAFGRLVRDDKTLDNNIAFLNDEIQRREGREVMLAGSHVPEVTGTSFEVVAVALAVGLQ